MRRLLQLRKDEVKAVYHDSELVKGLIAMCRNIQEHLAGIQDMLLGIALGFANTLHYMYIYILYVYDYTFSLISVDFEGLEAKTQIDIEETELNKFMEVHPFEQIASPVAGVVSYYDLDDNVRDMAEILHKYKESHIFKICWESQAKDFAGRADGEYESEDEEDLWATVDLIYEDIFQPCYNRYQKIYETFKDGSMTFEAVDQIFKDYKGKYVELEEDVKIMSKLDPADDNRWIQRRIQQIEQYHELHLAVESAQVVMKVKETLGLQGDFQVLEKLLIVVSKKKNL